MGRDRQTGDQQIAQRTDQRSRGRPFLDRVAQRQPRHQGQQAADSEEQQSRQQAYVQARNSKQMSQARIPHRREIGARNGAPIAGHERCRDRSGRTGQCRVNAATDAMAQALHLQLEAAHGQSSRRRFRSGHPRHLADRVADRAETLEIGVAPEVERTGQRRRGRRHEHRAQANAVARRHDIAASHRHAHPFGQNFLVAPPRQVKTVEHQPLPGRQGTRLKHTSSQHNGANPLRENRCVPCQGVPLRDRKSESDDRGRDGRDSGTGPAPRREDTCRGQREPRRAEPQRWLRPKRKVKSNSNAERGRQPKHPALALGDSRAADDPGPTSDGSGQCRALPRVWGRLIGWRRWRGFVGQDRSPMFWLTGPPQALF